MDKLSALVATILAISMASERIVEILKGLFPNVWPFAAKSGDAEARRNAGVHILAGVAGALVAWASRIDILSVLGISHTATAGLAHDAHDLLGYAVLGLLASGGSAFWNHVLDILQAAKVQQEQNAALAVANASPQIQTPAPVSGQSAPIPAPV